VEFGYDLEEISKHTLNFIDISSTKIRNALLSGDVKMANQLLGYRYSLTGLVVKGLQNGRKLGYPTANLQLSDANKLVPALGIYAALVYVEGAKFGGMLSVGTNPTFDGKRLSIEVNILDFDKELYGTMITIEIVDFIRQEQKFDSIQSLIQAIDGDKIKITNVLGDI
jgi:riboflavin kinase/FMN adenylyltransferase